MINELPGPSLTQVFRLHAVPGAPLDLGDRLIVPFVGGRFTGPELNGNLVPEGSADWRSVLPDGTVVSRLWCTLRTDLGDLLHVRSRAVGHGAGAEGPLLRATMRIQAASARLAWVNRGVFVSVGARRGTGTTYETYLVS